MTRQKPLGRLCFLGTLGTPNYMLGRLYGRGHSSWFAISFFLAIISTPALSHATSGRISNPVYRVSEVSVEIMIGGSGERIQTPDAGLLDQEESARFTNLLIERVTARLKAAGITARKGAGHALLLEFWGRKIPDSACKPQYVVEVSASFHFPAEYGHDDVSWSHAIIEIAPAGNLEEQLTDAVGFLVDELLKSPTSSRRY